MSESSRRFITTLLLAGLFTGGVYAQAYRFSGGPSGGTFQYYASAISTLSKKAGMRVLASSSGGSIENIRLLNNGRSSFAVAYSGHVWAARNGQLTNDDREYEDVLAVAYLYGAPAQLVVRADSEIKKPMDLVGKRVGVGNAGSGAAANAELYFKELGIWDQMDHENLGYRQAAGSFKNGQLDAFWVFAGFPNASILEAALQTDVVLLDLHAAGEQVDLFTRYPFFSKVTIPANSYSGQTEAVETFQDAALWVANRGADADVVYNLLTAIYSDAGLTYMVEVHKSAASMTVASGTKGIVTPLHPGAERFWKEHGTIE